MTNSHRAPDAVSPFRSVLKSYLLAGGCVAGTVAAAYLYTLPKLTPKALSMVVGYCAFLPLTNWIGGYGFAFRRRQKYPDWVSDVRARFFADRHQQIQAALDHAFESLSGVEPLAMRKATYDDAMLIVEYSHLKGRVVVEVAEDWLRARGISDVNVDCIDGLYVLLDTQSGLSHDLEAGHGCLAQDLPGVHRLHDLRATEFQSDQARVDAVYAKYAQAWLEYRSAYPAAKLHHHAS